MNKKGLLRLIVTAGPTREWLDPVRFLSNPASGQSGWQIASYAHQRELFAEIVYISGPGWSEYQNVAGAHNIFTETTADMAQAVQDQIGDNSLLIMTAAPADYQSRQIAEQKQKKNPDGVLKLELVPTVDILKSIIEAARGLQNFWRVGFAAETRDVEKYARDKLVQKELDLICANQVFRSQSGFGQSSNTLVVLGRDQSRKTLGPSAKKIIAANLLDYILDSI